MTQNALAPEAFQVKSDDTDAFALKFVDDAEYEFVGGGNAVNGF